MAGEKAGGKIKKGGKDSKSRICKEKIHKTSLLFMILFLCSRPRIISIQNSGRKWAPFMFLGKIQIKKLKKFSTIFNLKCVFFSAIYRPQQHWCGWSSSPPVYATAPSCAIHSSSRSAHAQKTSSGSSGWSGPCRRYRAWRCGHTARSCWCAPWELCAWRTIVPTPGRGGRRGEGRQL